MFKDNLFHGLKGEQPECGQFSLNMEFSNVNVFNTSKHNELFFRKNTKIYTYQINYKYSTCMAKVAMAKCLKKVIQ